MEIALDWQRNETMAHKLPPGLVSHQTVYLAFSSLMTETQELDIFVSWLSCWPL